MIETTPFEEVKAFIKRQRSAGRYKAATAKNLETACAVVEGLLTAGDSTVGYVVEHLDDLFNRYGNLNPKVGKATLVAYKSRVMRAVRDYKGHRTDPQWQPGKTTKERPPRPVATVRATTAHIEPSRPDPSANVLRHRLPLRANFDVEVLLPRDFSAKEAKKVSAWIATLTFGEDA